VAVLLRSRYRSPGRRHPHSVDMERFRVDAEVAAVLLDQQLKPLTKRVR